MNQEFLTADNENQQAGKQILATLFSQFEEQFPSESDCLNELYELARIEMICRNCKSRNLQIYENRRAAKCADCYKESWFTADTFLDHIKKPKPRLAAIWLMTRGAILKARPFSVLLDVDLSTAHGILKWARFVIQYNLPATTETVHSSLFTSVFNRRSFETPARAHPREEQNEAEKLKSEEKLQEPNSESTDKSASQKEESLSSSHEQSNKSGSSKEKSLETFTEPEGDSDSPQKESGIPIEVIILKLITDKPVHFELLIDRTQLPAASVGAALTMLELAGEVSRLAGDHYVRCKKKSEMNSLTKEMAETIAAFLDFIQTHYGGISRRYLQNYIAAFWCYKASTRHAPEELLHMCFGNFPKSFMELRTYVTPLMVKLLPLQVGI